MIYGKEEISKKKVAGKQAKEDVNFRGIEQTCHIHSR